MLTAGSSPLVRGAPCACARQGLAPRIIPARAGSTSSAILSQLSGRDHPRSCGEHPPIHMSVRCVPGSSPLVRGAPAITPVLLSTSGIIPARAGSTDVHVARVLDSRDHPRSCGEHMFTSRVYSMPVGSSPLVRGAPQRHGQEGELVGIIPARAGSTAGRLRAPPAPVGSSPLVRGALPTFGTLERPPGIIPARAGSTTRRCLR